LRYFTFFGINMIVRLFPYASAPAPGLLRGGTFSP